MKYFIKQKDGHVFEFNNIKKVRTEYTQQGAVEIIVVSGQYNPRGRYKDVRILTYTIEDTNIDDVRDRLMTWLS